MRATFFVSASVKARIIAALDADPHATYADIARECEVSNDTVSRYAREAGLRTHHPKVVVSASTRAKIIAALKANPRALHVDIAREFGVSDYTVTRYAKQAGLEPYPIRLAKERREYVRQALAIKPNASVSEIANRLGMEDCRSNVNKIIKQVAAELGIRREAVTPITGMRRAACERLLKKKRGPIPSEMVLLPEPITPALFMLRVDTGEIDYEPRPH